MLWTELTGQLKLQHKLWNEEMLLWVKRRLQKKQNTHAKLEESTQQPCYDALKDSCYCLLFLNRWERLYHWTVCDVLQYYDITKKNYNNSCVCIDNINR